MQIVCDKCGKFGIECNCKLRDDNFDEWWNNLSDEQKRYVKDLVIARLKTMPRNLKVSIG